MGLGLKTYLHSRFHELTGRIESFGGGYHEWNCRRIRVMLDHYGYAFFGGKSVIELGAGFGELGGFFSLIGSKVTCLEGRKANVAVIRRRQPFVIALQHDLNAPTLPTGADQADFIIHFGVLYHLRDPDAALRQACKACTHMVLETECSDSDDPGYNLRKREHSYKKDQALDGIASSPSPAFVERVLKESGMDFERVLDQRLNFSVHNYDWPVKNTGESRQGQRRFWFVKRAAHLDHPLPGR
jgi:SAM-dependent methyltransferase